MSDIHSIAVVIPARDEQELIEKCLRSVVTATERLEADVRGAVTVFVLVVADGCSDATAELAGHFPVSVIEVPAVGVGAARALGVARALQYSRLQPERLWLANTDADSAVGPDWLIDQLAAARAGADVRIGGVRPRFADLTAAQVSHWRATHSHGEARTHVHGANLGVRASAYLLAGGFLPVLEHEDVDLVDRLTRCGATVSYADRADVVTSGRSHGRTPGGYAEHLRMAAGAGSSMDAWA